MKTTIIATSLMALSINAFAEGIYEGKNIYKTPAMLSDLRSETTRLMEEL